MTGADQSHGWRRIYRLAPGTGSNTEPEPADSDICGALIDLSCYANRSRNFRTDIMISCLVRLYLDSPSQLYRLEKTIDFHAMPRAGEWLKLANDEMGDYFAFRIAEITYREGSIPEVALARLQPANGMAAAFEEDELQEYLSSYLQHGWAHMSTAPNRHAK